MTKKNPLSDKAHEMYDHGMKLVDIAAELGVPQGTIRRWKSTQNWNKKGQDSASERSGKKSERISAVFQHLTSHGSIAFGRTCMISDI